MSLEHCPDTAPADWLTRSATPLWQLITSGPAGFEAFARLRFIPDPAAPGAQEADVHLPEDHPSDLDQARRALHVLADFTTTPRECYFCLWEGYSDIPLRPEWRRASLVEIPHRRYVLLRGPLAAVDDWSADLSGGHPVAPPAFVWPADHRWCFAGDVDPHWAGIGAARAAVDALVATSGLDVVRADPAASHPEYR